MGFWGNSNEARSAKTSARVEMKEARRDFWGSHSSRGDEQQETAADRHALARMHEAQKNVPWWRR